MDDFEYDSVSEDEEEMDEEWDESDDVEGLETEPNTGRGSNSVIPFTSSKCGSDQDGFSYETLTPDGVVNLMSVTVREVNEIIPMDDTTLRILLAHYKWDKERLLESYYECEGNNQKVFDDAHVVNPFASCRKQGTNSNQVREFECEICCLPFTRNFMTGLGCQHHFCKGCWTEYLRSKIMDQGMSQTISCPAYGCEICVTDEMVMSLITDKKVRRKYLHLISNTFVECNSLLRWCPAPNCLNVIKVQFSDARPVKCTCGKEFCFKCGESWHDPVLCVYLKRWIKKCDDDSETYNWIAANTKECPLCQATIEKDGGCNHMVCRSSSCKHEFCWVCLGPWEPHGSSWYQCSRFKEEDAKKARDSQEKSRQALQRYLFYCNRYMNHLQNLRFDHKLYAQVKLKMEEMQKYGMSWIEVQFLKKAVDILCECRQMLMYSYVFAFFLKKSNQSIIFENNQADLEKATEQLCEYLERDITTDALQDIKQKVQDKWRYCDNRRQLLLKHIYEGYDNDLWEFNDIK